jgi:hypothetical protein
MSMSTHVIGFIPGTDETYAKNLAAWKACKAADLEPPAKLFEYFGLDSGTYQEPDPTGRKEALPQSAIAESRGEAWQGIDIDLRQVPAHIRVIRFYNSW